MESYEDDILDTKYKNIFEILFRKNVFTVILFVILANGYSNIPGVSELLTDIFGSHILRTSITFILFFQIIDNVGDSVIWTIVIVTGLYIIEQLHKRKIERKSNIHK
jgi:hypothetical protein